MRFPSKHFLGLALSLAMPAEALADCSNVSNDPCIDHKMQNPGQYYQLSTNIPTECLDEMASGAAQWNNVGSKLLLREASTKYTGAVPVSPGLTYYQVAMVPNVYFSYSGASGEVNFNASVGGFYYGTSYLAIVDDGDVKINRDRYMNSQFECQAGTVVNREDMGLTMGHEFGHVAAFGHSHTTSCLMYVFSRNEIALYPPCAAEATIIKKPEVYSIR